MTYSNDGFLLPLQQPCHAKGFLKNLIIQSDSLLSFGREMIRDSKEYYGSILGFT